MCFKVLKNLFRIDPIVGLCWLIGKNFNAGKNAFLKWRCKGYISLLTEFWPRFNMIYFLFLPSASISKPANEILDLFRFSTLDALAEPYTDIFELLEKEIVHLRKSCRDGLHSIYLFISLSLKIIRFFFFLNSLQPMTILFFSSSSFHVQS